MFPATPGVPSMGSRESFSGSLLADLEVQEQRPEPTPRQMRDAALAGTPDDRAEFTRAVSIDVEGYKQALDHMECLLEKATKTRFPGGLWITGKGGEGKSFILDSFLRRHPPIDATKQPGCDVLRLSFKRRPSEDQFFHAILRALGESFATVKRHAFATGDMPLDGYVRLVLRYFETKVILFDEAHHLLLNVSATTKRTEDRAAGQIGETLKGLYDETGIAFVFAGTPGLRNLVEAESQTYTRWPGMCHLRPFEFDSRFIGLLRTLDEALPMRERSGLFMEPLSRKIFDSCRGNFRLLKNFLADAVRLAAMEGASQLSERHLARAFFMSFCDAPNPFGAHHG